MAENVLVIGAIALVSGVGSPFILVGAHLVPKWNAISQYPYSVLTPVSVPIYKTISEGQTTPIYLVTAAVILPMVGCWSFGLARKVPMPFCKGI